ncbi:MAG: hypothetical protein U0228_11350 [Myxococcaceae bacterium]
MVLVAALAVLSGCPGKINEPDGGAGGGSGGGAANGGGTGGGTGGGGGGDVDAGYTKSAKGNVRFKGDLRLTIDLAVALSLPLDQLCNELGQYACLGVHTVALMGVDPYGKGLFEPLPVTGATTPVVTERMVMASCLRRVTLDLMTPSSAVIFKSLGVTGGKLTNLESTEVRLAINELAQRAWLRDPTDAEVAVFKKLYTDIDATGVAEPATVWMQSACFTAFTTAESVFY